MWSHFRIPLCYAHYIYFIPRREFAKAEHEVVHLNVLCFIKLVPRRVLEMPISATETKMTKCFILLRKSAKKEGPEGVHFSILRFILLVPWRVLEMLISVPVTQIQKCFIVWWVDGWVVFFYPLWFSLFSSITTSNEFIQKTVLKSCICLLNKKLWSFQNSKLGKLKAIFPRGEG